MQKSSAKADRLIDAKIQKLLEKIPESDPVAVNALSDWVQQGDNIQKVDYATAKLILTFTQSIQQIRLALLRLIKAMAAMQSKNDLLKDLGYVRELSTLMQTTEDADMLAEGAQALEHLKKCAPASQRTIYIGYDELKQQPEVVQDTFGGTHVAWRIWDASIVLSKWLLENKKEMIGKNALELGSGCCGVTGMVAAHFTKEIALTDYLPKIVQCLKQNIRTNFPPQARSPKISAFQLDWKSDPKLLTSPAYLRGNTDLIIGSDIMYEPEMMQLLIRLINSCLGPRGVFYGVSPTTRNGVKQFIHEAKSFAGLEFSMQTPSPHLNPDVTDFTFFTIRKQK